MGDGTSSNPVSLRISSVNPDRTLFDIPSIRIQAENPDRIRLAAIPIRINTGIPDKTSLLVTSVRTRSPDHPSPTKKAGPAGSCLTKLQILIVRLHDFAGFGIDRHVCIIAGVGVRQFDFVLELAVIHIE